MRIRSPIKYHGGKYYLAPKIVNLFPAHHTYVEPFCGAASVFLNKEPAKVEVLNDISWNVTNMFRVLRDEGAEFQRRLQLTPYSEIAFDQSAAWNDEPIDQAVNFFIRSRMSIGGRKEAFSYSAHRSRGNIADVVNAWLSMCDEMLPIIVERLKQAQVMCRPAVEIIKKFDSGDTLFYCDPPYLASTRTSEAVYDYEMSREEHEQLAEVLNKAKGKIVLSGYQSDLYSSLYGKWIRYDFSIPNHAAGGKVKRRMVECVWKNF